MLSNPESLLPSSSIVTSSTPASSKASTSAFAENDSGRLHHVPTKDLQKDETKSTYHHSSEIYQSNPIDLSSYNSPSRGGIFFSPPRNADLLTTKRIRSQNLFGSTQRRTEDEEESERKWDSYCRFSSAFSQAIIRGNTCLDLDNQNLYTIPDLSQLVEEQKMVMGHLQDKVKINALIEKMVNPSDTNHDVGGSRQPMTRAKSAPLVSFSLGTTASLILSNNYLSSSSFANLHQICYFQGLQQLSLRSNRLTEVPPEFGNLKNLKVLNLAYNSLKFLPSSILQLKHCKLHLMGNPWLKPPANPPLGGASFTTPSDPATRQFRWLSQSRGIFYFSSPASNDAPLDNSPLKPSIPSLLETCLRKLCISTHMEGEEEKIIRQDEDGLHHAHDLHPSSLSMLNTDRRGHLETKALLPPRVLQILADPAKYFYRCDLCKARSVLKPGSLTQDDDLSPQYGFQFRSPGALFLPPQYLAHPQHISVDPDLVPIRWNICHLNCCLSHLTST